jgi:hypothetical protein
MGLKAATLLKGVITLGNPPGFDTQLNYIFQDQAVALQEQYDRLLRFQASLGGVSENYRRCIGYSDQIL